MGHYINQHELFCEEWRKQTADLEPSYEIEDTATWQDFKSELLDKEEAEMIEDFEQASLADLAEWDKIEDVVNHPQHYTSHPSGIECIQITEHLNFCLGNALKYVWRAGLKNDNAVEDLKKAAWYIQREIERMTNG